MQSLNSKNIDDLQSYLIHSDGFSLCPLQHYFQHAVQPTSSRLLCSPQNISLTVLLNFILPVDAFRDILEAKFIWAVGPDVSILQRVSAWRQPKPVRWGPVTGSVASVCSEVREFYRFNAQLFHHHHHHQKLQNSHSFCCWLNLFTLCCCWIVSVPSRCQNSAASKRQVCCLCQYVSGIWFLVVKFLFL